MKQQLNQDLASKQMQRHISNISISFKTKEAGSKSTTPNTKHYKTIDQAQEHADLQTGEGPRDDSPLQVLQIVGQYKTSTGAAERTPAKTLTMSPAKERQEAEPERVQTEGQETLLDNKRGSKKSENTVTFDFHPDKAVQPDTARDTEDQAKNDTKKSRKTLSFEKSENTRSSPNSKKIENTIKKATQLVQNAKTSISNPVNRLSSLSGPKNML